jgi:flagellar biosynthesis/type III secretory pathway chaperone
MHYATSGDRAASRSPTARASSTVDALADVLRSEVRLLNDLAGIMRRQRDAVGKDDLDSVDESVFATHRVLLTLAEARRRRRSLNHLLGEGDDLSVAALDEFTSAAMPGEVRTAVHQLGVAARTLRREVDVNRRVLRLAIEAGEDFVRGLCGATASPVNYSAGGGTALNAQRSAILDRTI